MGERLLKLIGCHETEILPNFFITEYIFAECKLQKERRDYEILKRNRTTFRIAGLLRTRKRKMSNLNNHRYFVPE